tara:strand:+ start:87 stop:518 length:432 start_codon:yes stop_codon:yes gene_type:complete
MTEGLTKLAGLIDDVKSELTDGSYIKIMKGLKDTYEELNKGELYRIVGFITFVNVSKVIPEETLSGLTEIKINEITKNHSVLCQARDTLNMEDSSSECMFKHNIIHKCHLSYIQENIVQNGFCKINCYPLKNSTFFVLKVLKI